MPRDRHTIEGFLGLTNYYSSYVEGYAELAASLTAKLRLNREEGRKGSKKRLTWKQEEIQAFGGIKKYRCPTWNCSGLNRTNLLSSERMLRTAPSAQSWSKRGRAQPPPTVGSLWRSSAGSWGRAN